MASLGYAAIRGPWKGTRLLVVGLLVGTFVAGLYAGRWLVKHQVSARLRQAVASVIGPRKEIEIPASESDWESRSTQLARVETSLVHLPDSEGWGGGIQALPDGRIFYATRTGEFGVLDRSSVAHRVPFRVEMNLDALEKHPVYKASNFNINWVRVTDIDLKPLPGGAYELVVGHHYFEAAAQCMRLRLSRAVVREQRGEWILAEPFRVVLTTDPCITFNPANEFAFSGHFSGGRIVRMPDDTVLFSTGDHGWIGTRGYPALAQDNRSTLGKILRVDLTNGEVRQYAKGVRNPQGLLLDSKGRVWETEHGPRGGDELNLLESGGNYGWPTGTYGTDYGPRPWPFSRRQGQHEFGVKPQFAWVPSIGVSNLIEYTGDDFPLWKGDLLVISLTGQAIHRLRLDGERVVYDETIPFEGNRLRDITQLPDGQIALLTDSGKIIFVRNGDRTASRPFLDVRNQQPRTEEMSPESRALALAGPYLAAPHEPTAEPALHADAEPVAGSKVFASNCAACHSLDSPHVSVGPTLQGVVGRRIGSTDFAYSKALAGVDGIWSARRIIDFATNPRAMYAGTLMAPVVLNSQDRQELEHFLEMLGRARANTSAEAADSRS